VFDTDGAFSRESQHPGTPCGLFTGADQHIWLAHGHTGQIMKRDLHGKVAPARPRRPAKYGEAHYIAVSPRRDFRGGHAELAGAEVCDGVGDRGRLT
jgi:hypothetical protein